MHAISNAPKFRSKKASCIKKSLRFECYNDFLYKRDITNVNRTKQHIIVSWLHKGIKKACLGFCLMIFFVAFSCFDGFAGTGKDGLSADYGNSNIVYASGCDSAVIIEEGRITVTEGSSIRLLPGTRIGHGDELQVSIVSREHQETLVEEAVEKQREHTVKSIMETAEVPAPVDASVVFRYLDHTPGNQSSFGQSRLPMSGLPVRTQTSPDAPVTVLLKDFFSHTIPVLHSESFQLVYYPCFSWGERAETIKVMLA